MPEGWPLTLGGSGLILHLGELEASALRLGECYLCVRSVAAATATATTSSVNGVKTAGKTAEQNTVEVSHVLFPSFSLPLLYSWSSRKDRASDVLRVVSSRENDNFVLMTESKTEIPGVLSSDRSSA